ncbi:site-specific DNA-methyltransferase [Rothia mucilaginosa]|uniref:site-specific DNA-methyltransferase n=1 Tax=Rothia mucilaginosa TaxID=43675 RepID=UPI0028E598B2|nr:site-specific DNA-methyltransferase [Rothia mucilaginosa]
MSEVSEFGSVPLSSPDMRAKLWEQLQASAPEVFADGKLNVEALQNLLGDENLAGGGAEKFGLTWPGKREAQRVAQLPTSAAIHPQILDSVDWESTRNVFIEGENLETLKALRAAYRGKVKMVYIDPPYNTGKDFVYSDRFAQTVREHEMETGARDAEGALTAGTAFEKNAATSGAYHSNWLSMMYPRLVLARELLAEDGLIFISIDDYEVDNLRAICNEIFGQHNSLNENPVSFIWPRSGATAGVVRTAHEYILVYAKNRSSLKQFKVFSSENDFIEDRAIKKISRSNPESSLTLKAGMRFEGDNAEFTGTIGTNETMTIDGVMRFENGQLAEDVTVSAGWAMKSQTQQWMQGKDTFDTKGQRVVEFFFNKKGLLRYRKERSVFSPSTILESNIVGTTRGASNEIAEILGYKNPFSYPKPTALIQYLMSFCTSGEDIILDFFAGSGTIAQAVVQQNIVDQQNRRYIAVQLREDLDQASEAFSQGDRTIPDVVRHRLRNLPSYVHEKYAEQIAQRSEDNPLDTGFRAFTLGESCFKSWKIDSSIGADNLDMLFNDLGDSLKPGAEAYQVLFELLLKAGYRLDETIVPFSLGYKEFFAVAAGVLAFTTPPTEDAATIPSLEDWEKAISKFREIYGYEPVQLLMIEDALSNENNYANVDSLKLNLVQLAKQHGINREDVLFA